VRKAPAAIVEWSKLSAEPSRVSPDRPCQISTALDALADYFFSRECSRQRHSAATTRNPRLRMRLDSEHSLLGAFVRIFRDMTGASATLIAIALPGLIGFGALGAETGVWYLIKLQNQSAADAAAISAAYEVVAGKTDVADELTPAANEAATGNGYRGSVPTVTYPYNDGIVSGGIAVSLQQSQGAFLSAMFLPEITVTNKAVAVIEMLNNACILALGTSGSGIEIADLAGLDMPHCSAVANSIGSTAIELDSGSSITAATLVSAGEVAVAGDQINPAAPPPELALSSQAMIGAPSVADPYAGWLTYSYLTSGMPRTGCSLRRMGERTTYSGSCVIDGIDGLTITTGRTVDLSPGTYWITRGDLRVESKGVLECSACDNATGTGVTIILTEGAVAMATDATVELNAPNSGAFAGLLIVQISNRNSSIGGGSGSALNGLLYLPNSSLTFHGNPSVSGPRCLAMVVDRVDVNASSSLDSAGCGSAGVANLPTVLTVALAE
jgi:Flp pilus assembly protein TadG